MDQVLIRNFAIIAHVDHGKSTLADRLLERTGAISQREMRAQFLDNLDLERERGITIKLKAVRLYRTLDNRRFQLNLIDTPGHVDFGYEVSRSLAACEGVVLVVDASQGIQAQTVANVYKALEQRLTIIPFVNKVDLSSARVADTVDELVDTFGFKKEEIILGSAKEGTGVEELLEAIIRRIKPPAGIRNEVLRALIFDSLFDEYKGVLAFVRLVDGSLNMADFVGKNSKIEFLASKVRVTPLEIGYFSPSMEKAETLFSGEIGYIATGLKEIKGVWVGDTITQIKNDEGVASTVRALPGYEEPKSMVFLGLYPLAGDDFKKLRFAMDKLRLTDSSLTCEVEVSKALGFGFRCGFLGLLHADIVQQRLEGEYHLKLISTTPAVSYTVVKTNDEEFVLKRASDLPDPSRIREIREPYVRLFIYVPQTYTGSVLRLLESYRADYKSIEYLGNVVCLSFEVPLSGIVTDFYDKLKSATSGFGSVDYEFLEYRIGRLCRLDILVAGEVVEPLSQIVPRERAEAIGRGLLSRLKGTIGKHQFIVVLQAAVGGKIVAREEIPALRKNVLAKMSGGHRERKDKLLDRQREGKRRLKTLGRVTIPQEAFRIVLGRTA